MGAPTPGEIPLTLNMQTLLTRNEGGRPRLDPSRKAEAHTASTICLATPGNGPPVGSGLILGIRHPVLIPTGNDIES